jgi:hypothetical protein
MKKITKTKISVIVFLTAVLEAGIIMFLPEMAGAAKIVIKRSVIVGHSIQSLINQKFQTKDDWVDSGGTTGEYTGEEAAWRAVAGSPFNAGFATSSNPLSYAPAGENVYLMSGVVKQDTRTGLWWSGIMTTGAVTAVASSTTNNFTLAADGSRPTGGNAIGFCDALNAINFGGYNNWYLPTQKELMQAYIDGSANNLPNPDDRFWSSSEISWDAAYAWSVGLGNGGTYAYTKATSYYVRCVRR